MRFDLGLGSALGFGGFSYTYSPVDWFGLEAGVGMGFSGPTVSLMPKYSWGTVSDRLVLGLGVSAARNWAYFSAWANADIGWEHVFDSGVLLSAAVGLTAGDDLDSLRDHHVGNILPQGRIGVGYAFGAARNETSIPVAVEEEVPADGGTEKPARVAARWTRKNRLGFDFGLFSALGFTGLSYSRQLADDVAVEAGVGFGGTGVQLSLMPKLTLGSDGNYYVAGVGAAYAAGISDDPMFWLNADLLGYERRMSSGMSFFVSLGLSACMSGKTTGYSGVHRGIVTPQVRLGGAYWL